MSTKKSKHHFLPDYSHRDPFGHMNNRLNYLSRLKDVTDGFKAKQYLIDARRKHLQNQQMLNYQGEYDRIMHALGNSAMPGLNIESLRNRRAELHKLGVKALQLPFTRYEDE